MKPIKADYASVRENMKPGDVIAFSGKGTFSEVIKWATWSPISHVAVLMQTRVKDYASNSFFNQIIESTSLNDFNGVQMSQLSQRLEAYHGDVWWLPLREPMTAEQHTAFYEFLFKQAKERKRYDMPQAIKSALDLLDKQHGPGYNHESFERFFCSELVAAGLEKAGVVPQLNSSEVTPINLCRWDIFTPKYYQLKVDDKLKKIRGYNTLDPAKWDI